MKTINKNLLAMYFANFFWTFASIMIFSTVTLYHEVDLKVSKADIGSIQAYAVLSMQFTKLLSGIFIDIFRNFKGFILFGSILSMFAKPAFALVSGFAPIFYLRSFERSTKALRAVPVDAFISVIQGRAHSGRAFAIKQIFYTMGGIFGAVTSTIILTFSNNNFRLVYLLSIVPGLIATLVIIFFVNYPKNEYKKEAKKKFRWKEIKDVPWVLWTTYLFVFLIALARFGENYIGHRFYESGYSIRQIPLVYIFYDFPFALISLCATRLFDYVDWKGLLAFGVLFLGLSNIALAYGSGVTFLALGAIFYGLHMGITQGLFLTLVSKTSPPHIQGTSYALLQTVLGLGLFAGNKMMGYLSCYYKTWRAGFYNGFGITLLLFIVLIILIRRVDVKKSTHEASLVSAS